MGCRASSPGRTHQQKGLPGPAYQHLPGVTTCRAMQGTEKNGLLPPPCAPADPCPPVCPKRGPANLFAYHMVHWSRLALAVSVPTVHHAAPWERLGYAPICMYPGCASQGPLPVPRSCRNIHSVKLPDHTVPWQSRSGRGARCAWEVTAHSRYVVVALMPYHHWPLSSKISSRNLS